MSSKSKIAFRAVLMTGIAVAGITASTFSSTAQAQALQPAVDVCTGISLEPSAVTDIIDAANDPLVTGLSTITDNLLEIDAVVGPLPLVGDIFGPGDTLNITDLDLEIDDILAAIAAGENISLTVLDQDGNLVAPGDCNIAGDGFTLNDEGGIAIGGNEVSGLGENGMAASAGELDAIALGNNATTAVGATGAVAIGEGATVTAAGVNSVALGAGSVADRGPMTGYVAPGLAGTFDSAGTVSVGDDGALRQITNVAPGTEASDAATLGQVQAAYDAVAAIDATLDDVVTYDDAGHGAITFDGAGGTTLTNVAPGTLDAASSDAVNGSQLFATNELVAGNAGDIGNLQIDVAANSGDIADLQDTAVMYDDATQASVTLGGAGGTTVTNVADGTLDATSSDAVNGSQLFATNQQVDQNTINIQANTDAIAAIGTTGDPLGVAYDGATRTSITLEGAGGTTISNVADGELSAGSEEAVNGSQLFATNQQVDTNTGAIGDIDDRVTLVEGDVSNIDARVTVNEGDIDNLQTQVATNTTDIDNIDARVTTNTTDIDNIDARVTVNEGDIGDLEVAYGDVDNRVTANTTSITNIQAQVDNVPIGYVSDTDPTMPSTTPTNTAALIGAAGNPVVVTNVAAGNVAAGSTDAVNGSQLAATNDLVGQNRTDIDIINNNLSGSTVVAVQYSDPDNPTVSNGGTITNDVTFVGANSGLPVAVHNVAAGTAATDAVNLGQLQSGMADVLSDSMTYTDQQFGILAGQLNDVAFDLDEFRDEAFAGTAGAMAVAGIPQTMEPGRSMVGGAVGHYRGETAFAIGFSTTLSDGQGVVKAGGTMDTHGKGGFSAGAGFSF